MNERIEQKFELSKSGFNAFLLNELADVKALQLAIFDTLAEIKAEKEDSTFEVELQKLNGKRLMHLTKIMSDILNDYGSIPDHDGKPS